MPANIPASKAPQLSIVKGQVKTTSIEVAKIFIKRHDNVIRDIRNLECSTEFRLLNFEELEIIEKNAIGKETRKMHYEMTRDGWTMLVMGFTGKKAMAWKERYIAAFNTMERRLLARQRKILAAPGLTPAQQLKIQEAVRAKAHAAAGDKKPTPGDYMHIYGAIKARFKVARYSQIPPDRFDEVLAFLEAAPDRPALPSPEAAALCENLEKAAEKVADRLGDINAGIRALTRAYGEGWDAMQEIVALEQAILKLKTAPAP